MSWIIHSPENTYDYSWYHPRISDNAEMEDEFRRLGVTLYGGDLPNNPVRSHFIVKKVIQSLHDLMIVNRDLRRIMRRQSFDIVHINTGSQSITMLALWQAKRADIPVRIAHSHNADGEDSGMWIKRKAFAFFRAVINRCATQKAACSRKAAEWLFGREHSGNVIQINNCIEAHKYAFSVRQRELIREKLGLRGNFVVGEIARLADQKNQKFLVDVFREIHLRRDDARLLLVGDGSLRAGLEEYVNQLGLS